MEKAALYMKCSILVRDRPSLMLTSTLRMQRQRRLRRRRWRRWW